MFIRRSKWERYCFSFRQWFSHEGSNYVGNPSKPFSAIYNWRRFTLLLSSRIYFLIKNLLDDSSEEVLIFDDSTYDRSRFKKVELLSRVFDHSTSKYLKGFRFLTLGWSDGNSFPGIDFALLSSAKEKNRYNRPRYLSSTMFL
ncbi:hypothetical protein BuS5_01269 [Desulfosarcina sp. BuS5]|nr:hypothetical protein BuS5_01269 [Desulfosarcina sp. BuS5]